MAVKIQLRRGTAVAWSTGNPVLMEGEVGVDLTNENFRIGDGVTNWDDLDVATGEAAPNVSIEYSSDGSTGWDSAFTDGIDKYIRFSVDNEVSWSTGYKFIGEDGGITGGTLTGDLDFDGYLAIEPNMRNYTEVFSTLSPSTAGVLTLNLVNANVFEVTSTQAVTSLVFSGASTSKTNSFTMSFLSATTGVSFAWQTPYSVVAASTSLTAVSSCGFTGPFASNVKAGDLIDVSGFSTAAAANNSDWRIISATTAFLSVVDSTNLVDETSTGGGTVTRRKDYFIDGATPDAPEPYAPKVYTGYSRDADRWRIIEVGEF